MIKRWSYEMHGTGGDGQTWATKGTVDSEFGDVVSEATRDSFEQLTEGRAVFGMPGVGCRGPYDIHKVTIEQVRQ